MSWFENSQNEWKAIIETVAGETGRIVQMVEKDTIQSMFLYGLSGKKLPLVFKGGTSLSKAYGLIHRFSEDIDLSADRKITESERKMVKECILSVADQIGLVLMNPEDIYSRYSFNKYVFQYESLFWKSPLEIIVETSFYQPVYPVELHEVSSFVGTFCKEREITLPILFDASNVIMAVQSLERTMIDKVFAICDYRLQNMQNQTFSYMKIIRENKYPLSGDNPYYIKNGIA